MQLFYQTHITESVFKLNEDNARHVAQVLRMQVGEQILLTNGQGLCNIVQLSEVGKKNVIVNIVKSTQYPIPEKQISLGIAFTKNNSRMEWLLEKITEIGIAHIHPIITQRSEHNKTNLDRFNKILIAAICQSKQYFLPQLHQPIALNKLVSNSMFNHKFIAHCIPDATKNVLQHYVPFKENAIILIGPEGDFTQQEIDLCIENNYAPVSLGNTRLRTETAGLVGVTLLNNL
jgi:16S rRNA (uracil1498-N3)-methyltransferase